MPDGRSSRAKPFRDRLRAAIARKCDGNIAAAALEAGIEYTTLWYFMHRERGMSLRSFALLCTWAQIDANDVLQEFTA